MTSKNNLFILLIILISEIYSQNTADIYGVIRNKETQEAINGVEVEIIGLELKTESNSQGNFEFSNVPVGNYSIRFSAKGYENVIKTDIVVLSARPTVISVELSPVSVILEEIEVRDRYFQKQADFTTSSYNLDFEEVRRAPGAVEDVSRMVQTLPGVSPANDQRNDLIVRGGSPAENLTIIDGIEVPNINHYPTQGSSSGPIGMINAKFISEVNFSTGGFSARYGDRLSSVMEIRFREGSRKRFLSDINLSTAGFGGIFEGPVFSKGSIIFSIRKSYLNLIRGAIRLAAVPDYWDFNLKAVYDLNEKNKLTFLAIAGIDKISFEGEASEVSDDNPYGKARGDQQQFSVGFNLRNLFSKGFIQTVISNSSSFTDIENRDIRTDAMKFYYNSLESQFSLKSEINYQLKSDHYISSGISAKMIIFKNNTFFNSDTTMFGEVIPEVNVNYRKNYFKFSSFLQYRVKLLNSRFTFNAGTRFDYFSGIKERYVFSPRTGIVFQISPSTDLSFSTGIYYQSPDYLWISSDPENYNLRNIKAVHYVAGLNHFVKADLRFSAEFYYKDYNYYPVSLLMPTYVLINGGTENGPNIIFGPSVSKGYGFSRGIDISIQKKLTGSGVYGMLNYSLMESRVTGLAGGQKPGSFDYRHNLTVIAGYQITDNWMIGVKFRYTTGRPYTPFNIEQSLISGRGVADFERFNEVRYKDYNRFDLRIDKKWNFKRLSIVSYIELQNLFNAENVYQYFWNEYKNEQGTIYQWKFLPVGGFSIQF